MLHVEFVKAVEEIKMLESVIEATGCILFEEEVTTYSLNKRLTFLVNQVEKFYRENNLIEAPPILRS